MQLPREGSSTSAIVSYGRYVARRCARRGYSALVESIDAVNQKLLTVSRRIDDLEVPEQYAVADRDAIDDDLDEEARSARLALASRGVRAVSLRPYRNVFPDGISYYVDANLPDQKVRYAQLVERLEKFLPVDDPVRCERAPAITALLEEWDGAVADVEQARNTVAVARTVRDEVVQEWEEVLNHVYAVLYDDLGKAVAERQFPRATKRAKKVPPTSPSPIS